MYELYAVSVAKFKLVSIFLCLLMSFNVINRPGVAGAVLQTPLLLIN